jgi:ParB family chromosome partitioning protein
MEHHPGRLAEIELDRLHPGPAQPRRVAPADELAELARSITEHGVIQPIVVTPEPDGQFRVVAGHRRLAAARQAGLPRIPALVVERVDEPAVALIENLQRAALRPLEEALALQTLIADRAITHQTAARLLGKSRIWVTETLGLLRLPVSIQAELLSEDLARPVSRSALIELSRLDGEREMLSAWEALKANPVRVRAVRSLKQPRRPRASEIEKLRELAGGFKGRVKRIREAKLSEEQKSVVRSELEELWWELDQAIEELNK